MINEPYTNLNSEEIDIRIAGTRIFDYLIDALIVQTMDERQETLLAGYRNKARIQFGYACVELVRAIQLAKKS